MEGFFGSPGGDDTGPNNSAVASSETDMMTPSGSTLDHALLETLFYNEMMMMDEQTGETSDFLSQFTSQARALSDAVPATADAAPAPVSVSGANSDSKVSGPTAVGYDFGLPALPSQTVSPPGTAATVPVVVPTVNAPAPTQPSWQVPLAHPGKVAVQQAPVTLAPAAGVAPAPVFPAPIAAPVPAPTSVAPLVPSPLPVVSPLSPAPTPPAATPPSQPLSHSQLPRQQQMPVSQLAAPAAMIGTTASSSMPAVNTVAQAPSVAQPPAKEPPQAQAETPSATPKLAAASAATAPQHQQRAKQLVNQFASLASRLGISLPSNVLQSLTAAAAINEAKQSQPSTGLATAGQSVDAAPQAAATAGSMATAKPVPPVALSSSAKQPLADAASKASQAHHSGKTTAVTEAPAPSPAAVQLRDTAEAAIAAVSEKRNKRPCPDESSATKPSSSQPGTMVEVAPHTTNAKGQLYKRRKKPRLEDCESRLSQLRAENDMLKRHVDNVTNKTQKFDDERVKTEKKMKDMVKNGGKEEDLNGVLTKFTEMYSDYGRHREQELTFHLEQLEKLAAPTNFTKMGLWSLGQTEQFYTNPKRNPIAGILMKELGITAAQGRKILENREKIKALCANIKQSIVLLGKLKALCQHKQKVFNDRMTKCQEILTPLQVVKLLNWVDEHSETLEKVCPGWGSERIRGKKGVMDVIEAETSPSSVNDAS